VLLDLRLPDLSGFDVCRQMRSNSIVPIIIVTAQTDTYDLVAGLEQVPTTTSPSRSCPRSSPPASGQRCGGCTCTRHLRCRRRPRASATSSCGATRVCAEGRCRAQPHQDEYRLLCEFADHANMVLSRDQLLERVWGYEYLGDSRLVDAHVRRCG